MNDLKVNLEKQQLFDKLLDLLVVLNDVCEKHGIKYFVYAGTMLGAVRHKGFIPWDDDVDVALSREDYNKLKRVALEGAFKFPYFLQDSGTDIGYPKGYCRLRNSNTTEIPLIDIYEKCNHGVFIDVFPLDALPDDDKQLKKHINKLKRIRMLMRVFSRYYSGVGAMGASGLQRIAYNIAIVLFKAKILKMSCLSKKYDEISAEYSSSLVKRVGAVAGNLDRCRGFFPKEYWEGKTLWFDFENIKVPVPEAYDKILKCMYGDDYMTPRVESNLHGETFFSATIPYETYIKENEKMLLEKRFEMTYAGRNKKKK